MILERFEGRSDFSVTGCPETALVCAHGTYLPFCVFLSLSFGDFGEFVLSGTRRLIKEHYYNIAYLILFCQVQKFLFKYTPNPLALVFLTPNMNQARQNRKKNNQKDYRQ